MTDDARKVSAVTRLPLDDDADLVRVVRHALHEITSRVAAQTQGWQLDEQERVRLQMPGAMGA